MSDQSPSGEFGTGPEYFSPPSEEDPALFDNAYDEFIHDTALLTMEPAQPSQDHALHPEIPDLNQFAQEIMETTQAASQTPITAVPEVGIQAAPISQNSTPIPIARTPAPLWNFFDLPPISHSSNLLDTSLTNSQLVALLNTASGSQLIGTQDQSEIEPPMVRSQPLPGPTDLSPYSLGYDFITPPFSAPRMSSSLRSSSTGPETPLADTHVQDNLTLPQVSAWMRSLHPILPFLPQEVLPSVTLHLYGAEHWFDVYEPHAFNALYLYAQALINSIDSCQPIPQSEATPSETTNAVLGKRVRRHALSNEGLAKMEESSAEEITLPEPQCDEQRPTKKRKTPTTTTTKRAAGSGQIATAPTKHRNSFILYRCLVSKIKKWIQEQDTGAGNGRPPKKQNAEHQCVFSKTAGIVYKTPCRGTDKGLLCGICANCLMRGLFEHAAAQLKNDVRLLETQLRKAPDPLRAEFVPNRQRIDQAINWAVFTQIYDQSDLFRGHPELYIEGQMLTVKQIRAIWMGNEVDKQQQKFDAVKREFQ